MFKYREIIKDIEIHLQKKEFTIITGSRQVGKTTLLKYFYNKLKLTNEHTFFLSFENPEITGSLNQHPENIFRFIPRLHSVDGKGIPKRCFLFIDELQYLSDPSGFLKYLFDIYGDSIKVAATGSSSFYLDSKFKDSLAGRKRIFVLKPLNFIEFLQFKDNNDLADELKLIRQNQEYTSIHKHELIENFEEYLIYGGFPAVVLESGNEDKVALLIDLRNSFVKKDLYETGITGETEFFNLFKILAGQVGNLVNKNELAKTLKSNNKIIEQYLYVMQRCFHISLISPFYRNIRKEIIKMKKVYFYDSGLRNAFLSRFHSLNEREDIGQLIENYVLIRLLELYDDEQVNFWRTADGSEVDFIVNPGKKNSRAYEVKFNISGYEPKKYHKFTGTYPDIPLNCISMINEKEPLSILKL